MWNLPAILEITSGCGAPASCFPVHLLSALPRRGHRSGGLPQHRLAGRPSGMGARGGRGLQGEWSRRSGRSGPALARALGPVLAPRRGAVSGVPAACARPPEREEARARTQLLPALGAAGGVQGRAEPHHRCRALHGIAHPARFPPAH